MTTQKNSEKYLPSCLLYKKAISSQHWFIRVLKKKIKESIYNICITTSLKKVEKNPNFAFITAGSFMKTILALYYFEGKMSEVAIFRQWVLGGCQNKVVILFNSTLLAWSLAKFGSFLLLMILPVPLDEIGKRKKKNLILTCEDL